MKLKFYILNDEGKPLHEPDHEKWKEWFNSHVQKIAENTIGEAVITTTFLGHAFEEAQPVLWEAMVFGGRLDQIRDRCAGDIDQARAMHARLVERVKNLNPTKKLKS